MMVYLITNSLRPLRTLSETCAKVSEGNLKTVDVQPGPGEVRTLEETFNRMVAALREKATVEANLRRAQRLSAIGNLAAGVAHDVRNPLNAIKLLSSQALDELPENGNQSGAAKALHTIRSEVDRLEDIVTGFLSLAKEEELRREVTRLDPILDECLNLVRKDAESRGVRLIGELRAGDLQLALDAKKLKRAVLNVLLNALEACPPGGRVRLFSRVVHDVVEIEIRDDGPGMTPEAMEHAFDPYFTTKPTGTGLGLSITRGIIEEHGGTIRLTSAIDRGTQVLICLPLDSAKLTRETESSKQRGPISN
jgi:signal transduction histidine kinase